MVWCARVASVGAIQGSQPGGLDLITLFLLAKHLYLPARNEHPVTSLRTWLGGAFKRQTVVKDKIIKDYLWPEGLVLENIINSDLGRITYKPFWVLEFQSLVVTSVQPFRAPAARS